MSEAPSIPPGKETEAVASGRKRPWAKPGIRTLRLVGTRTGTDEDIDEDTITDTTHKMGYRPQS